RGCSWIDCTAPMTDFARYVLSHYGRLMTPHEKAVHVHLTGLFKARGTPPEPGTADMIPGHPLYQRGFSRNPAVIADAQAGWEGARMRIAERIVREHPVEVYLNHCPLCGALTRTPTANRTSEEARAVSEILAGRRPN